MLSDATIQELKQILEEDYGKNLDMKEVAQIAEGLVIYFNLLAKIYHEEKNKNYKDK